MFSEFESKPITRLAHKITEDDLVSKVMGIEATYSLTTAGQEVFFKAYGEVAVGDFVVHLGKDEMYHCTAKVFAERNIV